MNAQLLWSASTAGRSVFVESTKPVDAIIKTKMNGRIKKRTPKSKPLIVLTIGHSTRSIEEFIRLLQTHAVTRVVDARTVPRSRHNPQFNLDILPASLNKMVKWIASIEFVESEKALGKGQGGKNEDDEYFDLLPNI